MNIGMSCFPDLASCLIVTTMDAKQYKFYPPSHMVAETLVAVPQKCD